MDSIFIIHDDWQGNCIIKNEVLYRLEIEDEHGIVDIDKNKLIVYWKKWEKDEFYKFIDDNIYYSKNIYYQKFNHYIFLENEKPFSITFEKENNNFIIFDKNNLQGKYIIENDNILLIYENVEKIFKKYIGNLYILKDNIDLYFHLKIYENNIYEIYIFHKELYIFFNINNLEIFGKYDIKYNNIKMIWNNGNIKKFISNEYLSKEKTKNLKIIKPKNLIFHNQLLFSNISLCKNKIIFTSLHYKENNFDINDIDINIRKNKVISKIILDNDHYETSLSIIFELDNIYNNVSIQIKYKDEIFDIYLEQLNIESHHISAMTLFKDDILLLKRYLKYYSSMGVELFFLYYNGKIDHQLIQKIISLNELNLKIYLVEWNYIYWLKYGNMKHHFAQSMAVCDSLNILKNYGDYTLYNDLDEYIILNDNFNNLIQNNEDIDIFIFKNRFCKMGNDLISYNDFDEKFDLNNIILGNYWDKMREKNLIKLNNIHVMGIHKYFTEFNENPCIEKIIGEFYHIINFKEKNREILMTEYII